MISMKNIFLTASALLFFVASVSSQQFSATLTPSGLIVSDNNVEEAWPFDTLAVGFTVVGPSCTAWWTSEKFSISDTYLLQLPASFPVEYGFAVRRSVFRGIFTTTGSIKWEVEQTGECMALVLPAQSSSSSDTLYLQALEVNVPPGTYSTDWQVPLVYSGGEVNFVPTLLQPSGAKVEVQIVTSYTGFVVDPSAPLSAGIYYCTTVWEWQNMWFYEIDEFSVF